ncbi:hypothetical protein BGZ65_007530 [Modicella reniformis]|uniref:DUF221-domain-containing protein n=1 Tax=Modicella reniformis TaxID=1440133 RepID=A0A9P6M2F3_9FUNG|nr:hypothetical protein BGZ65_007530 [Modicella reniformis]
METPEDTDNGIKTFVSALIFNTAVAVAIFVAFSIVRYWNKKIYQPRTYLVNEDVRSPELSNGLFSWVTNSFSVPDHVLVERIGLDAYMFLRFMRMSSKLFFGFSLLAIPILIPLNVIRSSPKPTDEVKPGLLSLNIASTIVMLWREMQEYTRRRHAYLLDERHAKTPQSTTILVTAIPDGLDNEDALFDIFNRFPGGVRAIWLNKNPKNLADLCQERDKVVLKLEMAEYTYIRSAYGPRTKKDPEVKTPQRPIGRTSMIPFVGPKVDLIDFYTNRLFHTQFGAHSAVQTVVHPTPFRMAPMFAEISPLDVVWDNMNLNAPARKLRTFITVTAATALALFWSIPVTFVSTIAKLDELIKTFDFLRFLRKLPDPLVGMIQGILPPLFLAILMALLPVILTIMAKFEGHVRYSSITISVMKKYFVFLIINILLLPTLSGGFIGTIGSSKDQNFSPVQLINLMAIKLPDASTFFVTYALLQGFTGPFKELLQIAPLILNFLFTKLLAKSPRQIWEVQGRLLPADYGVIFPFQTLMFSVGMVYSTISPIVLPFVTFFFMAFYLVYRHQFLYVYQQPFETGGLAFPVAVKQAYTGIFIFEVTIFGIFLMKATTINVIPHLVLLFLLILGTALSLINMNEAFDPLVTFLPVALFSKKLQINENGVVEKTHESSKSNKSSTTINAVHEEEPAFAHEKGSASRHDLLHPESTSLAVSKQEYDEGADVSSQMPAVPTPNPSEYDAVSLTQQSLHPSVHITIDRSALHGERPVSYARSDHQDIDTMSQIVAAGEDPELRRLHEQAYCHPAIYNRQKPIWLPQDERGLVTEEITKLASRGIIVATTGADLDPTTAKAHVGGIVFAPGEETQYRLERGM